jgi:hypothetical protein
MRGQGQRATATTGGSWANGALRLHAGPTDGACRRDHQVPHSSSHVPSEPAQLPSRRHLVDLARRDRRREPLARGRELRHRPAGLLPAQGVRGERLAADRPHRFSRSRPGTSRASTSRPTPSIRVPSHRGYPVWTTKKLLIWGKTYPEFSKSYYETVCTGAVDEESLRHRRHVHRLHGVLGDRSAPSSRRLPRLEPGRPGTA